jgi:hypothetical protein
VQGREGSTQIKSDLIYEPLGWANYICLVLHRTRKKLLVARENELVWISHTITRATREHYESVRLGRVKPANLTSRPTSTAI